MNRFVAEVIGRKSRALKHCDKLLKSIEKEGQAVIKLNATGVSLPCTKGGRSSHPALGGASQVGS